MTAEAEATSPEEAEEIIVAQAFRQFVGQEMELGNQNENAISAAQRDERRVLS